MHRVVGLLPFALALSACDKGSGDGQAATYAKGVLTWYDQYTFPFPNWVVDYSCWGGAYTAGTA